MRSNLNHRTKPSAIKFHRHPKATSGLIKVEQRLIHSLKGFEEGKRRTRINTLETRERPRKRFNHMWRRVQKSNSKIPEVRGECITAMTPLIALIFIFWEVKYLSSKNSLMWNDSTEIHWNAWSLPWTIENSQLWSGPRYLNYDGEETKKLDSVILTLFWNRSIKGGLLMA